MNSSRKVFFYLLLVIVMIVAGVVLQFLHTQSKNQTAVNAEQIYALQQVHADTLSISNDLYQGELEVYQQFQTHQKVMEKRLRQFNQQSGLLKSEAARKTAAEESVELNNTWFALSQLLTTLADASPQLVAQKGSKNQLVIKSNEMLTQVDDLSLALGRESRLKSSVSSALNYVDLMAEASTIRSSISKLQELVKEIGELDAEPSNLSQKINANLKELEKSIELFAKDSDRVVKSKLIEMLEARDAFVVENAKWSENLSELSNAFLTRNAIQQRSEDFSLQLNAKLRSDGDNQQTRLLRLLAYLLPLLGAFLLFVGGRRYIKSMAAHLSIAQGSASVGVENAQQTEDLKQQLESLETQKDQLEADLEAQGQKMQEVASEADRYLNDIENFTSKLGAVETSAKGVKQENEVLKSKLLEAEEYQNKYRVEVGEGLDELQTAKASVENLERQNQAVVDRLREAEASLEKFQSKSDGTFSELESTQRKLDNITEQSSNLEASLESAKLRVTELTEHNYELSQAVKSAEEDAEKRINEASASAEELALLKTEIEQLNIDSSEAKAALETKIAEYDEVKKAKLQLDFEIEAQQQEFDHLLIQLESLENDSSQRVESNSDTTRGVAEKINTLLDTFSDDWHRTSILAGEILTVSSEINDDYQLFVTNREGSVVADAKNIENLQTTSGELVESLNKLSLGGKASAEIVTETSAMANQGVGSMRVINDSLESTSMAIEGMLAPLENLTENSQLMKSVVELLDSISEQAQSLDEEGNRSGLDITANDSGLLNSKYDLFENFRMATDKMTQLISEMLADIEGLATSVQSGMNGVQDSSMHSMAMAKLMRQVKVSQSQLHRLIRALLTQTDLQTNVMADFSDRLEEVSSKDQEAEGEGFNKKSVDQLIELCDELKQVAEKVKSN